MQRALGLGKGQRVPQKSGQEQSDEKHQQNAQQQEDELLDDESATIPFLRFEQEFHRRPFDAPVAQAVDEMDNDRRANQRRPATIVYGFRNS